MDRIMPEAALPLPYPMLAALALAALVVTAPVLPPPAPLAVSVVPPEPDAFFLPEAPTYQAVAADLDGDGAPEVVRLVAGERGAIVAEAWREGPAGWASMGDVEVVPGRPSGGGAEIQYAGTPTRLLVRQADGVDRVTLVRQPRFGEPGVGPECCILLHDLVARSGELRLVAVADPGDSVDAVLVVDLDGDGTDELFVSREVPITGVDFPLETRVYRWSGRAFAPPTVTTFGGGVVGPPFVLGDSDGLPGEEVGFITVDDPQTLFRLFQDGEAIATEALGTQAIDGEAVLTGSEPAIATLSPGGEVSVRRWPSGERAGPPLGEVVVLGARLLTAIRVGDDDRLLVRQATPNALHALPLPELAGIRRVGISRSRAAAAFDSGPVHPYVGPLPGGGPGGQTAAIYEGRLLPADTGDDAPFPIGQTLPIAALPGAQPIGLVGLDRGWLGLFHAPLRREPIDPSGGRLEAPIVEPGSGVSLARLDTVATVEEDAARLEPPIDEPRFLDARRTLAVDDAGFVATVGAPPGSRIYLGEEDPSVLGAVRIVPAGGSIEVGMVPRRGSSNGRQRLGFAVVTPAGHGYLATWEVRHLTQPPQVEAGVSTPIGSPFVVVEGRTAPYATVAVAGEQVAVDATGRFRAEVPAPPWPTDVRVVATDPLGNRAASSVSGVGFVDYRDLPWIPISVVLVALVATLLVLRVPRPSPKPRPVGDDAMLEEMDPD
jgi:hypothetical protein